MSGTSQTERVISFLRDHPGERFTARRIAEAIIERHPEDYVSKRKNPRFTDDASFVSQVTAEIGAQKDGMTRRTPHLFWQDKPRPRVYWFEPDRTRADEELGAQDEEEVAPDELEAEVHGEALETDARSSSTLSEHDLYPLLIEYLKSERKLFCQRIDERRSQNSRGGGGNQWLHPDIVAMQTIDKDWNELVRSCVKQGAGQSVRLWSFEVKKTLDIANVRKSFFQAVSNSSWANEGYLVAASISGSHTENELRMLSALHGIGVMLLNTENPSESDIMLPARLRTEVDWESINRLVVENTDFRDYIELVSTYYQTGRVRARDWNKV